MNITERHDHLLRLTIVNENITFASAYVNTGLVAYHTGKLYSIVDSGTPDNVTTSLGVSLDNGVTWTFKSIFVSSNILYSNISIDHNGRIWLAYCKGSLDPILTLSSFHWRYSDDDGDNWSAEQTIAINTNRYQRPHIFKDKEGTLWYILQWSVALSNSSYVAYHSEDLGANWTEIVKPPGVGTSLYINDKENIQFALAPTPITRDFYFINHAGYLCALGAILTFPTWKINMFRSDNDLPFTGPGDWDGPYDIITGLPIIGANRYPEINLAVAPDKMYIGFNANGNLYIYESVELFDDWSLVSTTAIP